MLAELDRRGVFWVTRPKDNQAFQIVRELPVKGNILRDQIVRLSVEETRLEASLAGTAPR